MTAYDATLAGGRETVYGCTKDGARARECEGTYGVCRQGLRGPGGAPEGFLTNEQLLSKSEGECTGIDFIPRDLAKATLDLGFVINELETLRDDLDGALVCRWNCRWMSR